MRVLRTTEIINFNTSDTVELQEIGLQFSTPNSAWRKEQFLAMTAGNEVISRDGSEKGVLIESISKSRTTQILRDERSINFVAVSDDQSQALLGGKSGALSQIDLLSGKLIKKYTDLDIKNLFICFFYKSFAVVVAEFGGRFRLIDWVQRIVICHPGQNLWGEIDIGYYTFPELVLCPSQERRIVLFVVDEYNGNVLLNDLTEALERDNHLES